MVLSQFWIITATAILPPLVLRDKGTGDQGVALVQGAAALRVATSAVVTEGEAIMDLEGETEKAPVAVVLIASRIRPSWGDRPSTGQA